jgi:hypothetical protein
MSADAARAAEILSVLSSPLRLRAFAALAERIPHGCSLTELAYALDVPLPEAGEAAARLVAAGIVAGSGNGFYRAHPAELRDAAAAIDALQPIAVLLAGYPALRGNFAHGRLTSLPPTLSERYALIGELIARFLDLDGLYNENEINKQLSAITDDVAGVRRMLVETGWLERDRSGSTYGPGRPLPAPTR